MDQLLLEVSVLSSWVTETELAVQALAKKMKKQSSIASKMAATKEVYYNTWRNFSSREYTPVLKTLQITAA